MAMKPQWLRYNFYPTVKHTTPLGKLIPELPRDIEVADKPINLQSARVRGVQGRLFVLSGHVTKLVKYERVEYPYHIATEVRGYVERLIVEAMRNGDCHRPTMELADFWLKEKQLIHKLFKVLVPRYVDYQTSFTNIYRLSPDRSMYFQKRMGFFFQPRELGVLELKGNPLPPLIRPHVKKDKWLTDVLLKSAKAELAAARNSSDALEEGLSGSEADSSEDHHVEEPDPKNSSTTL